MGNQILKSPEKALEECDKSVQIVQECLLTDLKEDMKAEGCSIKRNIHCRIYALPICPELHRYLLPDNQDLGMFLQIAGNLSLFLFIEFLSQPQPNIYLATAPSVPRKLHLKPRK